MLVHETMCDCNQKCPGQLLLINVASLFSDEPSCRTVGRRAAQGHYAQSR